MIAPTKLQFTLLLFVICFLATTIVGQQNFQVKLESSYIRTGIQLDKLEAKRISATITKGENGYFGKIILDSNHSELNEFGDPAGGTLLPFRYHDVTFTELAFVDPKNQNRVLYSIRSNSLPDSLYLVAKKNMTAPFRLLVKPPNSKIERVVPLQPIE